MKAKSVPVGYIEATKVFDSFPYREHKCPHCGYKNNAGNPIGGCAQCRASWIEFRGKYYYGQPRVKITSAAHPAGQAAEGEER